MNEMRYLEADGMWLLPSPPGLDCEVLVAGDHSHPDSVRYTLVNAATAAIEELKSQACAYLDAFVDRRKIAGGSEWYFEGLECGRKNETPEQFSLYFSLESDQYGEWSVTLQSAGGRTYPIMFSRRQV